MKRTKALAALLVMSLSVACTSSRTTPESPLPGTLINRLDHHDSPEENDPFSQRYTIRTRARIDSTHRGAVL